ncbi:VanZ family protein [Loigolactobacillus binensis]|uniref:VanZ family protein n=1 Tax=Loigolactobacillus binensis TaxID=2559922 RepID=A0ABW3EFW6_9LACO|nr:VanZ family protein [Loigolactobacillus binensis]
MSRIKRFSRDNWWLVLSLGIMILLFISSSETYKQQTSVPFLEHWLHNQPFKAQLSGISFKYVGQEVSIASSGYYKFIEFFIRKGAHFGSYFLMGLGGYMGYRNRIKQTGLTMIVVWLAATGYAALDEFHQSLTGGRTPLFQDVLLDASGALTAIVLAWLFIKFWRRRGKKAV